MLLTQWNMHLFTHIKNQLMSIQGQYKAALHNTTNKKPIIHRMYQHRLRGFALNAQAAVWESISCYRMMRPSDLLYNHYSFVI